jgi:hypothetical protein
MRFRKLRIAWSVGWGVVAVLLCVLWVRSYWRWESVQWGWGSPTHRAVKCVSHRSIVEFSYADIRGSSLDLQLTSWVVRKRISESASRIDGTRHHVLGFGYHTDAHIYFVPYWIFVVLTTTLSAVVWLRWRFRISTLLVVTMLIAVALGLIIWMA